MTRAQLLRDRLKFLGPRTTAVQLEESMTVENYSDPIGRARYEALVAFRRLRRDARLAACRAVLRS